MLQKILLGYAAIAFALFLLLLFFGKILKKDVLGNGVNCGILNSFLLSALWPISAIVALGGMCYEVVQTWKKI